MISISSFMFLSFNMLRLFLPLIAYPYKGENVNCPVCDSGKYRLISKIDRKLKRLNTVICEDCGLFFTNPMPTENELTVYYRDTYRMEYQFAFFGPPKNHTQKKKFEAKKRSEVIERYLPITATHYLDFGCGSGELVRHMATKNLNSFGFEPGASYSQATGDMITAGSYKIENADWQSIEYPQNYFDAITMLHVLEHLRDPLSALKKARSWLKDDGIFYLEVPNLAGYKFKSFEHFHFAHVLGFSRENLVLCARKSGFEVFEEIGSTSIIFKKTSIQREPDYLLLKETFQENFKNYSKNVSIFVYVTYHIERIFKRIHKKFTRQ